VEALGRTRADFLVTHESPAATSTVSSASTWRPPPAAPDSSSTAIITRATRRALGASAFWSADSERQRFLGSA
jgi:hypothetical protein